MTRSELERALQASAAGIYPLQAGVGLLIAHASFLDRSDFRDRFIRHGVSITDGITNLAEIDWATAITAMETGDLPCSGGERRLFHLAASLADGVPVDLRNTITGLDHNNIQRLINAILRASGTRQRPGSFMIVC